MFCYQHIGKVLGSCILQDCLCFMVKSIFIGQQFVSIWCLVEHSSVTTHRDTCSFCRCPPPLLPPPPPRPTHCLTHSPSSSSFLLLLLLPTQKNEKIRSRGKKIKRRRFLVLLRGCLQCLYFSLCVRPLRTLPHSPPPPPHPPHPYTSLHPPLRCPALQEFV